MMLTVLCHHSLGLWRFLYSRSCRYLFKYVYEPRPYFYCHLSMLIRRGWMRTRPLNITVSKIRTVFTVSARDIFNMYPWVTRPARTISPQSIPTGTYWALQYPERDSVHSTYDFIYFLGWQCDADIDISLEPEWLVWIKGRWILALILGNACM